MANFYVNFFAFWVVLLFFSGHRYRYIFLWFFAVILFFNLLYLLDYGIGNVSLYVSDEAVFQRAGVGLDELAVKDRILWIKLNQIVRFPLSEFDFSGKYIGFIFLPIYVYSLISVVRDKRFLLFFPMFFPFIFYCFQLNLRDSAILSLTLLFFSGLKSSKKTAKLLQLAISLGGMLYLRPFMAIVLIMSYFFSYFIAYALNGGIFKANSILKILIFFVLSSVVLYFLGIPDVFERYYLRVLYLSEEGVQTLDGKIMAPDINFIIYSFFRFIFTPIPVSLVERLITDGFTEWGWVHDISRIISQFFYFLFSIAIFLVFCFSPKRFFSALKEIFVSPTVSGLLICSLFVALVYGFYYGGGGHSRTKILNYHFVYIIVYYLYISPRLPNRDVARV